MAGQYRAKHTFKPSTTHVNSKQQQDNTDEQESRKRKLTEQMEKNHQDYMERIKRMRLLDRKRTYILECKAFFDHKNNSPFNVNDIPWPSTKNLPATSSDTCDIEFTNDDIAELFFCDINDSDVDERKKFLRWQQLQWHPDRFMQRCRDRMNKDAIDDIMERVNMISQILNAMS